MQHQIGPSRFFWWTERLLKSKTQTARLQGIRLNCYLDCPARSNKRWCFDPPMGVFFKKKKKKILQWVFSEVLIFQPIYTSNSYLKRMPYFLFAGWGPLQCAKCLAFFTPKKKKKCLAEMSLVNYFFKLMVLNRQWQIFPLWVPIWVNLDLKYMRLLWYLFIRNF